VTAEIGTALAGNKVKNGLMKGPGFIDAQELTGNKFKNESTARIYLKLNYLQF